MFSQCAMLHNKRRNTSNIIVKSSCSFWRSDSESVLESEGKKEETRKARAFLMPLFCFSHPHSSACNKHAQIFGIFKQLRGHLHETLITKWLYRYIGGGKAQTHNYFLLRQTLLICSDLHWAHLFFIAGLKKWITSAAGVRAEASRLTLFWQQSFFFWQISGRRQQK